MAAINSSDFIKKSRPYEDLHRDRMERIVGGAPSLAGVMGGSNSHSIIELIGGYLDMRQFTFKQLEIPALEIIEKKNNALLVGNRLATEILPRLVTSSSLKDSNARFNLKWEKGSWSTLRYHFHWKELSEEEPEIEELSSAYHDLIDRSNPEASNPEALLCLKLLDQLPCKEKMSLIEQDLALEERIHQSKKTVVPDQVAEKAISSTEKVDESDSQTGPIRRDKITHRPSPY